MWLYFTKYVIFGTMKNSEEIHTMTLQLAVLLAVTSFGHSYY